MPYQSTWGIWPVVWFREDQIAYMRSPEFKSISIITRSPEIPVGTCFGVSGRWLHRLFECPDESTLDRLEHVAKHMGGGAASQFLFKDIEDKRQSGVNYSAHGAAQEYTGASTVSCLNFKYDFCTLQPDVPASIS